ncbi:MAG: hypothetical protein ACLQCU_16935 [Acidimicrobiales bacterium]
MHVFLVRYGRTALNAAGVLRGQLGVPLVAIWPTISLERSHSSTDE